MNSEIIRFDLYGKKIYLEITKSNYSENILNCYAYVKKNKFKIFLIKEYIIDKDSNLFDKRCNSFLLVSEFNSDNKYEKLNNLIENTMKQVNKVMEKERNFNNSKIIITNLCTQK